MKGYKKKPFVISLMALGFGLIPVAMAIQMLVLSGGSWSVVGAVLSSPYFRQEWGYSWGAALSLYVVSRWSFLFFIGLSGTVLAHRLTNFMANPALETPFGLFVTGFWFAAAIFFLVSSLKVPYLNPKLRWWTRPARIPLSREAALRYRAKPIPVSVLNLSQGGAFLRLKEPLDPSMVYPMALGEELEFHLDGFKTRARLVWKAKLETPYRYGMGIQFIGLSQEQKRWLRRLLKIQGEK